MQPFVKDTGDHETFLVNCDGGWATTAGAADARNQQGEPLSSYEAWFTNAIGVRPGGRADVIADAITRAGFTITATSADGRSFTVSTGA